MIGKRDNRVIVRRRTLRSLLRIHTQEDFHKYLITDAVDRANAILNFQGGFALKSVFSICSGSNEAIYLARYPFERIVLSGVTMPNQELKKLIDADSRIEYLMLNAENTGIPSASFDLVFCKAGLHHCARPVAALYEMLRICRKAVAFVEPYEPALGAIFDWSGLRSRYERDIDLNIACRDNFVFRWQRKFLVNLLNSYYLDSGCCLDLHLGWMSSRINCHDNRLLRSFMTTCGWLAGFLPGLAGNQLTAVILPGRDLPHEPLSLLSDD